MTNATTVRRCVNPSTVSDPDSADCITEETNTEETTRKTAQDNLVFDWFNRGYQLWARCVKPPLVLPPNTLCRHRSRLGTLRNRPRTHAATLAT